MRSRLYNYINELRISLIFFLLFFLKRQDKCFGHMIGKRERRLLINDDITIVGECLYVSGSIIVVITLGLPIANNEHNFGRPIKTRWRA